MNELLKKLAKQVLPFKVQRQLRQKLAKNPHPDWPSVLERDKEAWLEAVRAAENGPRVLIATSVGGHAPATHVESGLAVALTLRGARVHLLLCDEALPACLHAHRNDYPDQREFVERGPAPLCGSCYRPANARYESLSLPVERLGQLVTPGERAEATAAAMQMPLDDIASYRPDGLAVGEHAMAGALRFFARGELQSERWGEGVLRRYLAASIVTTRAMQRLFGERRFDAACFHHGIYVPQGLIGEVARQTGTRVINWNPAYRKQCFIFSHGDTYHHTLLEEPVSNWEDIPWTDEMESEILSYLRSRWQGTRDWISFHEKPTEEMGVLAAELGLDFSKPIIGLLTNVVWDAQLHYRANAFADMLVWLKQTIEYFIGRPDLQLVIRIHPAEIRGTIPSRQPVAAEIAGWFPNLPPNIIVIPPEHPASTYAVMTRCNAVVIYGTKTGVELTSLGIPVVVAGEAWIRNKGLTMDANSPEEYFRMLDRLPLDSRLPEDVLQRARKYAYHFFFRRMIPMEFMEPAAGWPPYRIAVQSIRELERGRDAGLDLICEGILAGSEFIYPAERLLHSGEARAAIPA
jgi:hypothetical protein